MTEQFTTTEIAEQQRVAQQALFGEMATQRQESALKLLKAEARIRELEAENAELLKALELIRSHR